MRPELKIRLTLWLAAPEVVPSALLLADKAPAAKPIPQGNSSHTEDRARCSEGRQNYNLIFNWREFKAVNQQVRNNADEKPDQSSVCKPPLAWWHSPPPATDYNSNMRSAGSQCRP